MATWTCATLPTHGDAAGRNVNLATLGSAMNDERITCAVWVPVPPDDYVALRSLLSTADPLVTGNYIDSGSYEFPEYLAASQLGSVEFRALFDRNLLSPLVELAAGKQLAGSEESKRMGRVACACTAFCILADILIEPSIALYEYASTQGNAAAQADYSNFRIADNADPAIFIDIALGRADRLPSEHITQVQLTPGVVKKTSPEPNFEKALRMWRPNYLYVLKIASLRRRGLSPLESALEFQRWQSEDSFYNVAAFMYCLASVSHQPPKGKMFKGINSANPTTLRNGLRNAAWDICLIQHFGKFVTTPKSPRWSLWSLDKAVREIARDLFVPNEQYKHDALVRFYSRYWGRDGATLHDSYVMHSSRANLGSERRRKMTSAAFERIDLDIKALEDELGLGTA